jgi:phosphoenolpyruvate carboxylase
MEYFIGGYHLLPDQDKLMRLQKLRNNKVEIPDQTNVKEAIATVEAIQYVQKYNGEKGCNRYIISQCKTAVHVMEVFTLFSLAGLPMQNVDIDVVPLFETIEDLLKAAEVMELLYTDENYQQHLRKRGNVQTIMLGFSDGTKDGGYWMANWSIYQAKISLTKVSKQHDVQVVFFDGRGGPPARGGGKTHKFYSSLGKKIANNEIQLTIQGQTVSSNFGTVDSAQFNIEQLLNAGISNDLFVEKSYTLVEAEEMLLHTMAEKSFEKYSSLKNHPQFMEYLAEVSPLQLYAETNIGSRPAKRRGGRLSLNDLRAIPYVGAWSQLKQNVTGYFGVGTALKHLEDLGKWEEARVLYKKSLFFCTKNQKIFYFLYKKSKVYCF